MKKICIFCGSSMGFDPIYKEKAAELGHVLADNDCELLYGGGNVGKSLQGHQRDNPL